MAYNETEENCFTFYWKLENISYCLQRTGEEIRSPTFMVDAIDKTKWKLWLFPRGEEDENVVDCSLMRAVDDNGAEVVEIKYELAIITENREVLKFSDIEEDAFHKGNGYGFDKKIGTFNTRKTTFLPHNSLTVRCRIWKSDGKMTEDIECTARTCVGVQKTSFQWNVKNFSTLEPEKKCSYQINSIGNDMPLMAVAMFLTEGASEDAGETIRFELTLQDQTIKFSSLKLFLIGSSGNRVECNQEQFWFDDPTQCNQLTFSITKKTLLEEKNVYLPKDTLSLLWEWAFSRGVESEETEEDDYGCICPEVETFDAQNDKNHKTTLFNVLVDNMKSLYDEHFLSDVTLKTNTSVFPAHKFVLSTQSSVFKGMFSADMKEKIDGCVNIEELSDDTISRMLLFIYTTRVEDLTWESASRLYVAADRYAILSLKDICSSYLKGNLSPGNVCEVLLLSDFHADKDLKSAVQDYILKHGKQITTSDEWKALIETNAKLAAETLCLVFK